jgi:hypothetical protein
MPFDGRFPSTHWSEVARAADADPVVKRQALARLLKQYLPAFRAHLEQRRRVAPQQIEDLLQGFTCDQILAGGLIGNADRQYGKLRTFLQVALDRYVLQVIRHQSAVKRGGGAVPLSIGGNDLSEPAARDATASDAFDIAWARQVLAGALSRMREGCINAGRLHTWELFECRIVVPLFNNLAPPRYSELVERFGFDSPAQASNALITAKRAFARALRATIAQYADDAVEEELADLMRILARAGSGPDAQLMVEERLPNNGVQME